MQCFIAVDIDEKTRGALCGVQEDIAEALGGLNGKVGWSRPENIHLTLKFLGDVHDLSLGPLCRHLSLLREKHHSFGLNICQLGTFGTPVRVLWAGVKQSQPLQDMYNDITGLLKETGLARHDQQGRFVGHLTLGRIKAVSAGKKADDILKKYQFPKSLSITVDAVCLYRSDLTAAGPQYTILQKIQLL